MEELGLLLKSRYPIVCVESQEEERLAGLLSSLCRELNLAFFTWSVTDGLCRQGMDQPVYETQEPLKALQHIDSARIPAAYLLRDFHPYLGNLWRRLVLPRRIHGRSLTSLQQRLVKTGGRLVKHARYYWLLLAESHLTRRLFGAMLCKIAALPFPAG